ncbi:MAG: flagellar hook-basal body complex protein FliE [Spiribacter salinus]|uniref:Flagellar hook-basal body complex protein FliE n=1 Tax=Spiribacter salinus TaxID=1335746 RepID=A0A540VVP2_9GAMM|nr:MAG: flagellar hook-basal body complex protein FliE [Spiribacter salinus]
MDIRSLNASQSYAALKDATKPSENPGDGVKFTGELADDFSATLQQGEDAARAAMSGDADPHALVQALAQTEFAVEAAVTVRNKVVEAYQEILRMPV